MKFLLLNVVALTVVNSWLVSCSAGDQSNTLQNDLQENTYYKIGNDAPTINYDIGAGKHGAVPWTLAKSAQKTAMREVMPLAYVAIGWDAAAHLDHYLSNSGKAYNLRAERMILDVTLAKQRYKEELSRAVEFASQLPVGKHEIVAKIATGGYNYKYDDANWYYAVGGYVSYAAAKVEVITDAAGKRSFVLDFNYQIRDRYNWDNGKQASVGGFTITGESMGDFHRMGLAQEYNLAGGHSRVYRWHEDDDVTTISTQWLELKLNEKDVRVIHQAPMLVVQ